MKIGIICPSPHLTDFAILSNFHLILPHLYSSCDGYAGFYRERIAKGDFVVQDNSIFELGVSLDFRKLWTLAHQMGVSEMVAPEVLKNSNGTKALLEEFLKYNQQQQGEIQIQAVAQGSTYEEMIEHIFWLNSLKEVSTIGLPFDTEDLRRVTSEMQEYPYSRIRSLTLRRVLTRWLLIELLQQEAALRQEVVKPIHLMGLSDAIELQKYQELRASQPRWVTIRSNDSSSAFVHGAAGILYNSKGLPCEKIPVKLDFTSKLFSEAQYRAVHHNINQIAYFANAELTAQL